MEKENNNSTTIGCSWIVLLIIVFWGEPDLLDVIIKLLLKLIEKL
jgi:hypothetical protein